MVSNLSLSTPHPLLHQPRIRRPAPQSLTTAFLSPCPFLISKQLQEEREGGSLIRCRPHES